MIAKKGKEWKKKKFQAFEDLVKKNKYFLFFNFNELDIPAFVAIKKKMRELENQVMIAKNVFIRMLMNVKFEEPIAVVAVKKDPIKTLKELIKVLDKEKIRGSLIGNKFYNKEATLELSKSPDSEELRGMVVGSLYGMLYRLVSSLQWYPGALINILNTKSKEGQQ